MKPKDTDTTTTGGDTAPKKPAKRKTTTEMREAKRQKLHQERNGFDQTRDNAHSYLRQWTESPGEWKFNSAKQRWIVQHVYSDSLIPDDIFEIAVKYLAQSRGESLRAGMMDDARLVIDPAHITTGGDDASANARRLRALGLFPSHVTKGEANAMKKAKAQAKLAGASDAAPPPKPIVSNLAADQDSASVEVSESTVGRARRIIEALSKPPQQDEDRDDSSTSRKRKSASDAETTVTEKKTKKDKDVAAKEKKQAKKEMKKIKKEKRMEKEQRKARKLVRKAEKEKKRAKKKVEKAERKKRKAKKEKAKSKE
ncbi:hypothetical protein H4S06_002403 [Coemansia sp. BCRC 34490]|nr:hypothetical protein H4S06_002403 [Coemansia sp. BCRC 34490]